MPTLSEQPVSHKLTHVASWFLKRLPVAERTQFVQTVEAATSQGRPLRVGTMCSGTDSPVVVLDNLAKAVPGLFVKHVFSCEFDERKQSWIKDNFPKLEFLFGDVNELSSRSGQALNHITGEKVMVPAVDLVIAGFVCKSVSTENNERPMYANCIREGIGKTGETFDGVMAYVRKFKPAMVICENVKGLTMKNKDEDGNVCEPVINHVEKCFKRADYSFDHKILDSRDFLLPQRRARVWMWAFRGRESQAAAEETKKSVLGLKHRKAFRFGALFRMAGVSKNGTCKLNKLNQRKRGVVKAALRRLKPADRCKDVVVDVAKTAARAPSGIECTSCVVPNSQLYRLKTKTMLTPEQVHCVQGIYKEDFPALAKYTQERKGLARDLAGNAFSTTVCMAVVISCLAHAPLEDAKPAPSTPKPRNLRLSRTLSDPPLLAKRSRVESVPNSPSKRLRRTGSV